MQSWRIAWARNLKAGRKAKGWTQPGIASHVPGVSAKQISYYEMTGRIPVEHLIPLARALELPVEELFPLPEPVDVDGNEAA